MPWNCIACETTNFDSDSHCIVCGEERFFAFHEVKVLLENNPEYQTLKEQNKKLMHQNKWLQTRNRNLTQENKLLKERIEQLESEKQLADTKTRQPAIKPWNWQAELKSPSEKIHFLTSKGVYWTEATSLTGAIWSLFWTIR